MDISSVSSQASQQAATQKVAPTQGGHDSIKKAAEAREPSQAVAERASDIKAEPTKIDISV